MENQKKITKYCDQNDEFKIASKCADKTSLNLFLFRTNLKLYITSAKTQTTI